MLSLPLFVRSVFYKQLHCSTSLTPCHFWTWALQHEALWKESIPSFQGRNCQCLGGAWTWWPQQLEKSACPAEELSGFSWRGDTPHFHIWKLVTSSATDVSTSCPLLWLACCQYIVSFVWTAVSSADSQLPSSKSLLPFPLWGGLCLAVHKWTDPH